MYLLTSADRSIWYRSRPEVAGEHLGGQRLAGTAVAGEQRADAQAPVDALGHAPVVVHRSAVAHLPGHVPQRAHRRLGQHEVVPAGRAARPAGPARRARPGRAPGRPRVARRPPSPSIVHVGIHSGQSGRDRLDVRYLEPEVRRHVPHRFRSHETASTSVHSARCSAGVGARYRPARRSRMLRYRESARRAAWGSRSAPARWTARDAWPPGVPTPPRAPRRVAARRAAPRHVRPTGPRRPRRPPPPVPPGRTAPATARRPTAAATLPATRRRVIRSAPESVTAAGTPSRSTRLGEVGSAASPAPG